MLYNVRARSMSGRSIVGGVTVGVALITFVFLRFQHSTPQTKEEEVLSTVLSMSVVGIKRTDHAVVVEFRGSTDLRSGTVRRRVIRMADTGNLNVIDVHPMTLDTFRYEDGSPGFPPHELLIEIVKWRSDSEVVVSTSSRHGGGTYIFRFDGTGWRKHVEIESWVS